MPTKTIHSHQLVALKVHKLTIEWKTLCKTDYELEYILKRSYSGNVLISLTNRYSIQDCIYFSYNWVLFFKCVFFSFSFQIQCQEKRLTPSQSLSTLVHWQQTHYSFLEIQRDWKEGDWNGLFVSLAVLSAVQALALKLQWARSVKACRMVKILY